VCEWEISIKNNILAITRILFNGKKHILTNNIILNNNVIGQWSPINPQQGATVSQNNQQHRARVKLHKLEPTGMNHTILCDHDQNLRMMLLDVLEKLEVCSMPGVVV
jgi:hypothetical protein